MLHSRKISSHKQQIYTIRSVIFGFLFGILLFIGIAGCGNKSIETLVDKQPVTATEILQTSTPKPNATSTITKTPNNTATRVSPTRTITPTPSFTPTIEPSPTPIDQPMIIGYSVAEHPLEVYHYGNGSQKRMIIAGIHGGYEWNTIALADQLTKYLTENPEVVPENITLYILRSANPDGEARGKGSVGRANENGVDINRNFPSNWAREWDRLGCWNHLPITAGAYAGSEPETAAIMKFMLNNQIEALISYHSAALGIFAGGVPSHPGSHDLAQKLAAVSPYSYPTLYETGCVYTGQLADWAANHNISAVDIELSNHADTDYVINLEILWAFLGWENKK